MVEMSENDGQVVFVDVISRDQFEFIDNGDGTVRFMSFVGYDSNDITLDRDHIEALRILLSNVADRN